MNIPNALTCLRLVFTVIFYLFLQQEGLITKILALNAFLLAVATDYLDGVIARRYNLISDFGKIMDPIADKFLTLAAFYAFVEMWLIVPLFFWVVLVREVAVTLVRLVAMKQGRVLAAESLGKAKTTAQMVTIILALFYLLFLETPSMQAWTIQTAYYWINAINGGMVISVFLTVLSGITFFTGNFRVKHA